MALTPCRTVVIAAAWALLLAGGAGAQTPKYPIAQKAAPASKAPAAKAAPRAPTRPPAAPPAPPPPEPTRMDRVKAFGHRAEEIATQPVRDVGISKLEIPPVLVTATTDPYSLKGLATCRQLGAAVADLNVALGPDYASSTPAPVDNRAGKLAEAGGRMLVNGIIPFRSLVREVSGAAPAERRLAAAVDAGLARRGFLRGTQAARRCK